MELEHDGNDTETELIISEVEELLRTANVLLLKNFYIKFFSLKAEKTHSRKAKILPKNKEVKLHWEKGPIN